MECAVKRAAAASALDFLAASSHHASTSSHDWMSLSIACSMTEFKSWLEGERRRLSLKSTLGKALQYSLSRWDALAR